MKKLVFISIIFLLGLIPQPTYALAGAFDEGAPLILVLIIGFFIWVLLFFFVFKIYILPLLVVSGIIWLIIKFFQKRK